MCLPSITENAPRRVFSQFRECPGLYNSTTVAAISTMGQAAKAFCFLDLFWLLLKKKKEQPHLNRHADHE